MLRSQTAALLRFPHLVLGVVSKESLRKELRSFEQVSLSKISVFCDRTNYQQQHASLCLSITNISISHFPLIFLCLAAFMLLKTISFNHPFFISVENLTNWAFFDDCLIIPFHFNCISNSATLSSSPLWVHSLLLFVSACHRHWDMSDIYWLSMDLVWHACLGAAGPLKPSVCCFLSAEHVAL